MSSTGNPAEPRNVVIAGGGVAGLEVALALQIAAKYLAPYLDQRDHASGETSAAS